MLSLNRDDGLQICMLLVLCATELGYEETKGLLHGYLQTKSIRSQ